MRPVRTPLVLIIAALMTLPGALALACGPYGSLLVTVNDVKWEPDTGRFVISSAVRDTARPESGPEARVDVLVADELGVRAAVVPAAVGPARSRIELRRVECSLQLEPVAADRNVVWDEQRVRASWHRNGRVLGSQLLPTFIGAFDARYSLEGCWADGEGTVRLLGLRTRVHRGCDSTRVEGDPCVGESVEWRLPAPVVQPEMASTITF